MGTRTPDTHRPVNDCSESVAAPRSYSNVIPSGQQAAKASPARLTRDSLAAFQAELQSQNKRTVLSGPETVQSTETKVSKTLDDESGEVQPDESLSVLDGDYTGTAVTSAPWTKRTMRVFPTPADFIKFMRTWTDEISHTPELNSADSEKWLEFDVEPDIVTHELLRPPQAPNILVDPSASLNQLDSRRSTQTAESACLEYGLLVQADGSRQGEPVHNVQTATQSAVLQTPQQPSCSTVQSTNAKNTGPIDADSVENNQTSSPIAPAIDAEPNSAAGIPPLPPIVIHITLASDDHIDQIRDIFNEELLKGTRVPERQQAATLNIRRLCLTCLQFKLPFLVAFCHGPNGKQVLGFGFLQPRLLFGITEPQDLCCAECSVFVRLKYRNRGIGQEILQSILSAVAVRIAPQSNTVHEDRIANDEQLDKSVDTAPTVWPSYKFVRDFEMGKPDFPPPLIHYIVVEIECGNVDGLAEKKYIDVLTRKFGFDYGGQLDSVCWTEKGPKAVKKMMLYRICEQFGTHETTLDNATPIPACGPAQPSPARPVTLQPVASAETTVTNCIKSPSKENAQFLRGRLLQDLILAPTTTGNRQGDRAAGIRPAVNPDFW
ncbi:hypothetical protein SEPCBS57363_003719 [Sporothrix epigloea]|uniref:N-acetyltransferase domain-containing protein n=1 Tax=Sporothrix epigloea TaxID=1892477 RepID=A0ABP0DS81_9PEZI